MRKTQYFYSIKKASEIVKVKENVIRNWQKEFPHIECNIGSEQRKYYTEESIEEFKKIRYLREFGISIKTISSSIKNNKINVDIITEKINKLKSDDKKTTAKKLNKKQIEINHDKEVKVKNKPRSKFFLKNPTITDIKLQNLFKSNNEDEEYNSSLILSKESYKNQSEENIYKKNMLPLSFEKLFILDEEQRREILLLVKEIEKFLN